MDFIALEQQYAALSTRRDELKTQVEATPYTPAQTLLGNIQKADRHYGYSDDREVYRRGKAEIARLKVYVQASGFTPDEQTMLLKYLDTHDVGEAFNELYASHYANHPVTEYLQVVNDLFNHPLRLFLQVPVELRPQAHAVAMAFVNTIQQNPEAFKASWLGNSIVWTPSMGHDPRQVESLKRQQRLDVGLPCVAISETLTQLLDPIVKQLEPLVKHAKDTIHYRTDDYNLKVEVHPIGDYYLVRVMEFRSYTEFNYLVRK